jgi:hypothetical protein
MPYYISPPPQGPLTRIVAAIVAVFALVGAFMIGIAAFLVIGGIALVAGLAIWLRVAWIRRQLRKSGVDLGVKSNSEMGTKRESGHVIDAEYTVVNDREQQKDK